MFASRKSHLVNNARSPISFPSFSFFINPMITRDIAFEYRGSTISPIFPSATASENLPISVLLTGFLKLSLWSSGERVKSSITHNDVNQGSQERRVRLFCTIRSLSTWSCGRPWLQGGQTRQIPDPGHDLRSIPLSELKISLC